ncbi:MULTISPECIES: aspartate ammonia-lyase [Methanobacterium]|uniref:Aspartate ammonia-lyase n=1 Tax=Methanobacterium veterum TaxID=408577 RepID=A0A9E5A1Z5_9EURY|nr:MULTISPECIES: aspartate ammonia-lyase [Methanobacterium]MCZ3365411.1 aspartate ammonia-lyase [Methanobacterium veterum]MCZ3373162.1 aspartate ammonia-lyase [Methanobacterium veterum]
MRLEKDSIGEREIHDNAYYGIQTLRAMENFPVSGRHERPELIKAYILVKKAAAITNMELGTLDNVRGEAIVKAADEIISGKLADQFPLDIFQAGAGTSFNMNINEVLANRALEILGKNRGEYDYLSPNDHVNQSQSSNDTFPTASHIAVLFEADLLNIVLLNLADAFKQKGKKISYIPKSGRTHLMDAVPVTIGDEFIAYGSAIKRAAERIRERRNNLLEVAIGGTATGTGVNSPPSYRKNVVKKLADLTSLKLIPANDSFEALQSRSQMAAFSGALRELALELIRIANDLRLMGSGPTSGLNEIVLPPVQPGSSIMPGKVNPVMAECLNMISFQIIGNDTAVSLAVQAGQLDLNIMTPVMTSNILESTSMLNNYLPVFQSSCVEGIKVNEEQLQMVAGMNPILATLLSPKIGYLHAAELAEESTKTNQPIKDLVIAKGILSEEDANRLFNLETISKNRYRENEV